MIFNLFLSRYHMLNAWRFCSYGNSDDDDDDDVVTVLSTLFVS